MSTFSGKIQELPNISVDRFDGENINSEAYFLSHCHTDHMQGLDKYDFQQQLIKKNKYLYASEISCAILKKKHPFIEPNLCKLVLNIPHTISLKDKTFSVTLIPAGHCPGSVMFLFENKKRILYTGDYRISKNDIKKFKCFYNNSNKVKVIDKIYLDTTFFLKKYSHFPKREESLQELCGTIDDWLQKGTNYHVNLITSAKYGYEYVFKEIYIKIGKPIHVSEDTFRFYSLIPELDSSVTLDDITTRIHSHCLGWKRTCFYGQDIVVKSIKMSAFRWTQQDLTDGISESESGIHYICYSTHASYEEGVALIKFLKPRDIEICVKHDNLDANKEMTELIEEHLKEFNTGSIDEEVSPPKLFDLKMPKKTVENDYRGTLGAFNSPPRENSPKTTKKSFEVTVSVQDCINSEFGHSSKSSESDIVSVPVSNEDFPVKKSIDADALIESNNKSEMALEDEDNGSVLYGIMRRKLPAVDTSEDSYTHKNSLRTERSISCHSEKTVDSVLFGIINSSPNKRKKNDEKAALPIK